jgi:ATP-dependent Clp protease ATP-binding subunit ClpC
MPAYRYPVIMWKDSGGAVIGVLVEYPGVAAVRLTRQHVLKDLKDCLAWSLRRERLEEPDFYNPRLLHVRVNIRPEYRGEKRVYPCAEQVAVRPPCVTGERKSGMLQCALPTLGIHFDYYEKARLKPLIVHAVQERLMGLTPEELSGSFSTPEVALDEVVVHTKQGRPLSRSGDADRDGKLSHVADRLGRRGRGAKAGRAWEREKEIADLIRRLRDERANVILVGETGAGKTAVLLEAIRRLEHASAQSGGGASDDQGGFWLTSGSRLIAGMRYLGQWQERCEEVFAELSSREAYLCIENLLDLVRVGGVGPVDSVAAFFLPYLQRGELRLVAEATPSELDACRRLLPGLIDVCQILEVPPFDRSQALVVLSRSCTDLSQAFGADFDPRLAALVHRLFARFLPYRAFPGSAIRFLNELFDLAALDRATAIDTPMVLGRFGRQTGLPDLFVRDDILLDRAAVLETFEKEVIGQPAACEVATSLVTTYKAGLNDPGRPVGVVLFCGPTGVGKTALARALARFFFGADKESDRLVRLDMSEYAGPEAPDRLVGSPDGEPSDFVKRMRQQPFSVVLLDEVEKADPRIFDVLLNVLDEGRLMDRFGRITSFRSSIIIMTSNLGASRTESFGFSPDRPPDFEAESMAFFRPEFFNRIDAVVTFGPLDEDTIHAITRKELTELATREGLQVANVRLRWTERVVRHLAKAGFDRRYGARPLQRTIEELVVVPLSRMLAGSPQMANTTIDLDLDDENRMTFGALGEA